MSKEYVYGNTSSRNKTHFLSVPQLLHIGTNRDGLCSENWPYPAGYSIGEIWSQYYAEIWSDGMDWNKIYWVIEQVNWGKPVAVPLMYFENHKKRDNFVEYDFGRLLEYLLSHRRNNLWIKDTNFKGSEDVWPYLHADGNVVKYGCLSPYCYTHASQPMVNFLLNESFLPEPQGRIINDRIRDSILSGTE